MKRLNGIHLPLKKRAEDQQIISLPLPELIRIPMRMHAGAPCVPVVQQGDHVRIGQMIGRAEDETAVPIHASVSGVVTAVTDYEMPDGATVPCVEIRPDAEQLIDAGCQPPELRTPEDLANAARDAGCVGLGGDGSVTHLKLRPKEQIKMVIVNGAECETHLASDGRYMIEAADDIIGGVAMIMKIMKIKEARIGVQRNRPAAIRQLTLAAESQKGITVCPLPPMYPQGAEKVLIYHTSGIVVPEDQTPEALGILVLNVSTCAFLYQYSQTGIPLVERVVTVDGDAVGNPCNLRVPIGTPVTELLEYAQCDPDKVRQLLCGGLMMGECIPLSASVVKPQNGLIAMKTNKKTVASECIRCGRCMRACPLSLMPMELNRAYQERNVNLLEQYRVMLCMNCGCCTFACPAKRPLAEQNQLAKALLV